MNCKLISRPHAGCSVGLAPAEKPVMSWPPGQLNVALAPREVSVIPATLWTALADDSTSTDEKPVSAAQQSW